VVFGEGDPHAAVMFIGEGPGAEEDRSGRPFVGQAGQLLERILLAIGLRRDQVYITNIVKCRPPGNRDPKDDEVTPCAPYLDQQIELIRPRVLVALGKPASHRLTGTKKPISALRGRWVSYRGVPLMPLFHPAYMLRTPSAKREAWEDLKKIKARLDSISD
jgi:DNA polymerase